MDLVRLIEFIVNFLEKRGDPPLERPVEIVAAVKEDLGGDPKKSETYEDWDKLDGDKQIAVAKQAVGKAIWGLCSNRDNVPDKQLALLWSWAKQVADDYLRTTDQEEWLARIWMEMQFKERASIVDWLMALEAVPDPPK